MTSELIMLMGSIMQHEPIDIASGLSLWKKRFRARSWKARTRPHILRVVLGPCVQYCPCEASEQKMGQKPKYATKEIEL